MSKQEFDHAALKASAHQAASFLKALANKNRLMILCHLVEGERTVSELERELGLRQPTLSQQLARLRDDNLVSTRREAKHVHYALASPEAAEIIGRLYDLFCRQQPAADPSVSGPQTSGSDRIAADR